MKKCQSFNLRINDRLMFNGTVVTITGIRKYVSKRDGKRVYVQCGKNVQLSLPYYARQLRMAV